MNKQGKCIDLLIASIMILVAFQACMMRKSEPLTQKTFAPDSKQVAHGEQVYMMHCQKCHPAGEAGLGPALNSNPAPGFIKRFQMRHGLGVMPAFKKDEISKQDLKDIAKYLKAWKHYK
jgi:mono/diheme cytochrome c family protein